jgi:hypothetical protein
VCACRVGEAVGPFPEKGLDERFGLAVGLWPSWSGVAAFDREVGAGVTPGEGAVAVAVVAEDPLDRDPALGVPGDGAAEERDTIGRGLAREQFGVGEPRVVVDREVDVLPAGSPVAIEPVAVDPLSDRPEATEFLMSTWMSSPGRWRS